MREFVSGIKEFSGVRINWTAIFGLGVTLFISVGFWTAVINTTAALVKLK